VHPQIMWAKLKSLVEGARLASKELWRHGGKRPAGRRLAAGRAKRAAAKRRPVRRAVR
jgi:hypothetical protein